jgi:hypothetical protein
MSNALALRQAVSQGLLVQHPPVRISLDDGCEVVATPYEAGDDIHLMIECKDGVLRSVLGDVEVDGQLHIKTTKEAFARMVTAAKLHGIVPRVSKFLGQAIKRGPPLLR